ncbi:MAG: 4Fe-4S ferredoxin [Sphaerochaetaceae bacterium]|nr:4Fe-4S ferredoxin [Sphaerochaetaceae bacterium]MDX9808596.1 4Fe-4S ferredoxin [Sphaerochaetaceae bacterium]NLV83247.1 4Fe-4S ferredoxin [Spirochaetales bacterium]
MHAVRNIKLCTKDCLCLFVCPTGATNTETGQIDADKCLDGCRLCVDACPSHAISLVYDRYPEVKRKTSDVQSALESLLDNKVVQEAIALSVAETSEGTAKKLATALAKSNRILAEDCARESGYLIAQSDAVRQLLASMLDQPYGEDFPADAVSQLLELL